MKKAPDFIHQLLPGSSETSPVLMLFHGTGGTERDLLSLADLFDLLRGAGAEVTHRNHGRGHGLSRGEIEGATAWHAGLSE